LLTLLAVLATAALVGAGRASAQTFLPTNSAELQAALQDAQDGDVIQLAPTTYFLLPVGLDGPTECTGGDPDCFVWQPQITASITIRGSNDGASVIDHQVTDLDEEDATIFEIEAGASVTISHVTLKNATYGIDDESTGAVTVDHSTITGMGDAGFYTDAGGSVTLTNDTIAGNHVTNGPRGIGVEIDTGDLQATNVTIAGNDGDGLVLDGGTATVWNSIVAGNGTDCHGFGDLEGGASFDGDGSCASTWPSFATSSSLNLGTLAENGGPTSTIAIGSGSAAIGAGDPLVCPPDDQRDFLRVSGCDAGAFQANGVNPAAANVPPVISGIPADAAIEATGPAGAAYTYVAPTATDDVDGTDAVDCNPASGSTFPLGDTTVTCTATDSVGNTASAHFTVHVVDTTPPVLRVPTGPVAVDATSPEGAIADYTATATDVVDGAVAPSCAPAPGSTFPIGDTTVTCTATDKSGNTASPASFVVHVAGAAEQLRKLDGAVGGVGPGRSLAAKVASIENAVAAGDDRTACGTLAAFVLEVGAQRGKSLTATNAAALVAAADRITAVVGC
jgi:hypothetical protein